MFHQEFQRDRRRQQQKIKEIKNTVKLYLYFILGGTQQWNS